MNESIKLVPCYAESGSATSPLPPDLPPPRPTDTTHCTVVALCVRASAGHAQLAKVRSQSLNARRLSLHDRAKGFALYDFPALMMDNIYSVLGGAVVSALVGGSSPSLSRALSNRCRCEWVEGQGETPRGAIHINWNSEIEEGPNHFYFYHNDEGKKFSPGT